MQVRNSPEADKALRDLGSVARRLEPRFVPPALKEPAATRAWLEGVRGEFKTARRSADAALSAAQAQIDAAMVKPGESEASWRALEEACRRIEQELAKPTQLRSRLEEGRRSLLPKVEKVIVEHLTAQIATRRGRFVGTLDPAGIEQLRRQTPQWMSAWVGYVYPRLDEDLTRFVEDLWNPRQTDLPIAAPRFEAFRQIDAQSTPDLPNIEIVKEASGGLGGLLRHMRSVMYSVMSLGFMFGINLRASADGEGPSIGLILVMIAVVVAAFSFGILQNSTERARLEERLTEEVQRRGEQAVRESVRVWLDRRQDKIIDDALDQYRERRRAFIRWYRETVKPAADVRVEEAQARARRGDAARKSIIQLQATARDFATARKAMKALDEALAGP